MPADDPTTTMTSLVALDPAEVAADQPTVDGLVAAARAMRPMLRAKQRAHEELGGYDEGTRSRARGSSRPRSGRIETTSTHGSVSIRRLRRLLDQRVGSDAVPERAEGESKGSRAARCPSTPRCARRSGTGWAQNVNGWPKW